MSTQAIATNGTERSSSDTMPGSSGNRAPILVVEANADLGRGLVEQLAADGYPAQLACTAQRAESMAPCARRD